MSVEVKFLAPDRSDGRPYRATVITRDADGKLVGVRVLRDHTASGLREQVRRFRGTNAHDDIANQPEGI